MTDTVLLVDDEQHIIDLARMYIEQDGFAVTSATDGRTALERPSMVESAALVAPSGGTPRPPASGALECPTRGPYTRPCRVNDASHSRLNGGRPCGRCV